MKKFNFKLKENNNYYYIIIVFSLLISIYYGYRGVFPIDSFLIFDAGYKIQNNFFPFKDYWSITGPLLDYIQFILFNIFGLNWFSYVLHAALINCLVSCISFYFFLNFGLKRNISFCSSICIAILAYPSTGTPFMDHHAVIFSLISIIFLILGLRNQKKIYWFLSPIFLIFSFFSKQIPSGYLGILLILIVLTFYFFIKRNNNIFYFFYGCIFGLGFFLLLFIFQGIELKDIFIQYFLYPLSVGSSRIKNFQFDLNNIFFQFKFIYLAVLPLLVTIIFLIFSKKKENSKKIDILILFFVILSFCIFIYTQIITRNQILIFFLIPFFLTVSYFYVELLFGKSKLLSYLIIFVIITTTAKYHLRFNENKKFMELENINFKKAVNAEILDKKLFGLKWITADYSENPNYELEMLNQIKTTILMDDSNKIIISDYQILPTITHTRFAAPNKWFDELSVPDNKNKYFNYYRNFFFEKLKDQKIQTLYFIGKEKLDYFKRLLVNINCFESRTVNEISLVLIISDCY